MSAPRACKLTLKYIKTCAGVAQVGDVACRLAVPNVWHSIDKFHMVVLARYVFSKAYMPPPLPIVDNRALGV